MLYTIRVSNTGERALKMMEVKETMPTGMSYVVKSCSLLKQGEEVAVEIPVTRSEGTETIMWTAKEGKDEILEIASGASAEFTLRARIDETAEIGRRIPNDIVVFLKPLGGVGFTHTARAVVTVVEAQG